MTDVLKGKLVVISTKNKGDDGLRVTFPTKKGGMSNPTLIPKDQLHPELAKKVTVELNQLDIELELEGGQPRRIRAIGANWSESLAAENNAEQEGEMGDFHNPYNFIPAPPRKIDHSDLGDHSPVGHGVYHSDRWSGHITITLRTVTPLLIADAARALPVQGAVDHKSYPIRIDANDKPYLPPTSIKGMLRSAYEAVTNSRLSVFEKHSDRLAYRMPANIGLEMVPARVENGELHLYTGTSQIGNEGKPQGSMYAAWLPRYNRQNGQVSGSAVRYQGNNQQLPSHGDKVTVWLEKYGKYRTPQCDGNPIFTYWRVRSIARLGDNIGNQPNEGNAFGRHAPIGDSMKKVDGFVCVTNKNIDGKHDERVFFSSSQPTKVALTEELTKKWKELIKNYQDIHSAEINSGQLRPPALQHSVWSRHVTGGEREQKLSDKTLLYAHVEKKNGQIVVKDLYPVMITRGLFINAPEQLLDPSLQPAITKDNLSPADRVFGWVNQDGKGAYKGNIRIGNVQCLSNHAIERFGDLGFPLAILGQPKPQQFRFYTAQSKQGQAMNGNTSKAKGFSADKGLRGRKVYPHHQGLPNNHWNNPVEDRTRQNNNGYHQEYRRPAYQGVERDNQNRSIQAWVKPNIEFSFRVDVTNLSNFELGALLWLLVLPENSYHRLGSGKPLGFGSIRLDIDWNQTDLRIGSQWRDYYQSLLPIANKSASPQLAIDKFKQEVGTAYGNGEFDKVSFIKGLLRSTQGYSDSLPIHYPRETVNPKPEGEAFKWFTSNESNDGCKLSLPNISSDRGLPRNPRV